MRIRPIVIAILIMLLIAVALRWANIDQPVAIGLPNQTLIQNKEATNNKKLKGTTIKTVAKETSKHTPIAAVFDDDPVVDIQLIISNNRFCYRHLSNIVQTKDYLDQIKLRVSEEQFKYYQNYTTYCEKLKEQHPEFKLTNKQLLIEQNKGNKATSQWGKIINGEVDVEVLSNYEIQSLLKQNDVNILSLAPKYLESYYQKIIHWELEDVLQNHQYDYVSYIRHYSHQLYTCNIGADCGPNSSVMAQICYRNSMSCGLSFQEHTSSVLTQGQQADIQLAIDYLSNQYQ